MNENKIKILIGKLIINFTFTLSKLSLKYNFVRLLYRFVQRIYKLIPLSCFTIIDHRNYAKIHNDSSYITILKSDRKGYSSNLTYNLDKFDDKLIEYKLPDLYVAQHSNVKIHGNSDFVLDTESMVVINDFCYNMNSQYLFFDGILYRLKYNLAVLRYDGRRVNRHLQSGIMISGKYSNNYYHEMYENLIKLLLLKEVNIPYDVPIIVDEVVFKVPSFKCIFDILKQGCNRKVLVIKNNETIKFDNLYYISSINYLTPHRKNINTFTDSDFIFDLTYIKYLREKLLSIKSEKNFPKKIFLTRKNMQKRNFNEDEVFELIKPLGFEKIAPEEYSLEEQVTIFNDADIIIGGTGAAFTNLVFCHSNCKIICLQPVKILLPVFTTIAYFNDLKIRYCVSEEANNVSDIHTNFTVDVELLKKILIYFIDNE